MYDMQIRNPVVCDASKVSLYKKITAIGLPARDEWVGNLSQSDLYENKLSYSQHPCDAIRKLSQSQISLRF